MRLRIWAWIETSSAETGSSATISLGSRARARARPMRWRWPPENSWGYRSAAEGRGRPRRAGERRGPSAPRRCPMPWTASGSRMIEPTCIRGSREA